MICLINSYGLFYVINGLVVRRWIPNPELPGSKPLGGSRSTQPFIFLRLIKWVPEPPWVLLVKSKLSSRSGFLVLGQVNPIHKKWARKCFLFFLSFKFKHLQMIEFWQGFYLSFFGKETFSFLTILSPIMYTVLGFSYGKNFHCFCPSCYFIPFFFVFFFVMLLLLQALFCLSLVSSFLLFEFFFMDYFGARGSFTNPYLPVRSCICSQFYSESVRF